MQNDYSISNIEGYPSLACSFSKTHSCMHTVIIPISLITMFWPDMFHLVLFLKLTTLSGKVFPFQSIVDAIKLRMNFIPASITFFLAVTKHLTKEIYDRKEFLLAYAWRGQFIVVWKVQCLKHGVTGHLCPLLRRGDMRASVIAFSVLFSVGDGATPTWAGLTSSVKSPRT